MFIELCLGQIPNAHSLINGTFKQRTAIILNQNITKCEQESCTACAQETP